MESEIVQIDARRSQEWNEVTTKVTIHVKMTSNVNKDTSSPSRVTSLPRKDEANATGPQKDLQSDHSLELVKTIGKLGERTDKLEHKMDDITDLHNALVNEHKVFRHNN
ncbi:Hypothetical predicted protein [Pelobates cultripes]|uniref:Uncharacterized protein n=1 Tax=Pelobates cultripes TaxID=61616 RepID=A0AAD1RA42_PELCU|nr:Hypothetical predicted protein [Pelobates cultripes]